MRDMRVGVGIISEFDILLGGGRWEWECGRLDWLAFVWLMMWSGWMEMDRWMEGVLKDRQKSLGI